MDTSALPCKTLVIAFGHKSGHGKDTAATAATEQFGSTYSIKRYAFADEVRAEFYDLLLNWRHAYWTANPHAYLALPHPRSEFASKSEKIAWVNDNKDALGNHLQCYGTEFRRAQDPFCWIKLLRQQIVADKPQLALITDLRFPNEAYFVKAAHGYTVKVTRTGYVNPKRDPSHVSENALNTWLFDFEITVPLNSLEELKQDVKDVVSQIIKRQEPCLPEFNDVATHTLNN